MNRSMGLARIARIAASSSVSLFSNYTFQLHTLTHLLLSEDMTHDVVDVRWVDKFQCVVLRVPLLAVVWVIVVSAVDADRQLRPIQQR